MYEVKSYIKEKNNKPSMVVKIFRYFFACILLLFVLNFFVNIYFFKDQASNALMINPLAGEAIHTATTYINSRQDSTKLERLVQNVLGQDKDDYGIVIENLNTGERYYFNQNKQFETASLYKLWVMVVVFKDIQDGIFNKNDVLSKNVSALNSDFGISSESAELTEGTVSRTVEDALTQMITVSDNYSAYLLTEKIGVKSMASFLTENGFSNSKTGTLTTEPVSTPSDMALFFKKLYQGELANKEYTDEMLNLLKQQEVNNKLPKDLPQGVVMAHKTGDLNGYSHDVGIVYTPKGNYIIVIMSNTDSPLDADDNIALISKSVYKYFTD